MQIGIFDKPLLLALFLPFLNGGDNFACAATPSASAGNEVRPFQTLYAQEAGMPQIDAEPYPFRFNPAAAALVIIDMQRDFLEPGGFAAPPSAMMWPCCAPPSPPPAASCKHAVPPGSWSCTPGKATVPTCRISLQQSVRAAIFPRA